MEDVKVVDTVSRWQRIVIISRIRGFGKNVKERVNPREWLGQSLMVPNDDSSPRVTASVSTSSFAEFSMYKLVEMGLKFDDSPPTGSRVTIR